MAQKWTAALEPKPVVGDNVLSASQETIFWQVNSDYLPEVNRLLREVARGDDTMRQRFIAAMTEPILKIIPYVSLYDRFFVPKTYTMQEDTLHPTETVINVAVESHPQAEVMFNQPNFLFTRPTYTTFQTGVKIPWGLLETAGWDLLGRQMNQVMWELTRKRDAKAKTTIDNAVPTSHKLTHTGGLVKATVDTVIRKSNEIGFPVTQAVINPGRLMEAQSWNWVMPTIPEDVARELINNLYYGNYGGINWFVNPNAVVNTIYFGGPPEMIGWHDQKGDERTDRDTDITKGEDIVAIRDRQHAYTVENDLSLWTVAIV